MCILCQFSLLLCGFPGSSGLWVFLLRAGELFGEAPLSVRVMLSLGVCAGDSGTCPARVCCSEKAQRFSCLHFSRLQSVPVRGLGGSLCLGQEMRSCALFAGVVASPASLGGGAKLLWVYGVIWVGRDLKDQLIPSPAILSTSPRYSEPCPSWPWPFPGMGQSRFPSVHGHKRNFPAGTETFPWLCPAPAELWEAGDVGTGALPTASGESDVPKPSRTNTCGLTSH